MKMTHEMIANQRMLRQRIQQPGSLRPEEVVRRFGAMQAQDYGQAVWAIGLRTPSAGLAEVEQAIAERKLLLTWTLRGTLHFIPPENAKWMLQLCAPRIMRQAAARLNQLALDDKLLERCRKLLYQALKGGRQLERQALLQLLEQQGISTAGQRGYHILWHSAYSGLICFGPRSGKQQTFVLLDEWAADSRELSFSESLAELARLYFTAHGPATVQDFAWWAGLTLTDARAGHEAVRAGLLPAVVDGCEYWQPAEPGTERTAFPGVHLLAGFDEYILGYKDRSAVLDPETAPLIVPGNNGIFLPTLIAGGRAAGTWKRTIKRKGAELFVKPFAPLNTGIREEVQQAAERYAAFLDMPLIKLEYVQ
ncbi:winged helix DNA-binding domain-containing protein [Paenibacillus sp. MMS20-IR301]|uniref:winged helix DNA-binding domain-containing protein n=1 Tax=Paenibacillus sp. MMS20-IR301 TaxID=2895946 RepID=UPI0028E6C332|nr:winged helix DNA-binding domain-containing protein [Paenibacillus sp. MMS20-IR301]WNS44616.1 winged helix DNA-binding domain-containing protein [Paenibacillus sp. MMS20-IR301]